VFTCEEVPKNNNSASLNFLWFEICTSQCNLRCVHCYTDSVLKGIQETSVVNQRPLTYLEWCRLIKETRILGCTKCQFIGGEPLLYRGEEGQTVFDLSEYAVRLGYQFVEIFSNLILIKSKDTKCIKELGLKIATTLYSSDEKVHDTVTRTPGSYRKTVKAIKTLVDAGVSVRAEIVITKLNQETIEETVAFKEELGLAGGKVDLLRPTGRGLDLSLLPDTQYLLKYGLITKPNFCTNPASLCNYTSFNSCLRGKLTVTEFGDFLPCIFSREILLGNYRDGNVTDLVQQENVQKIWKSSKDSVLVCKDCEYRYCCNDCRAVSFGSCGGRVSFEVAPYPRCTYNPYTGEWLKGVWVVNKNGEPFYDRRF